MAQAQVLGILRDMYAFMYALLIQVLELRTPKCDNSRTDGAPSGGRRAKKTAPVERHRQRAYIELTSSHKRSPR